MNRASPSGVQVQLGNTCGELNSFWGITIEMVMPSFRYSSRKRPKYAAYARR